MAGAGAEETQMTRLMKRGAATLGAVVRQTGVPLAFLVGLSLAGSAAAQEPRWTKVPPQPVYGAFTYQIVIDTLEKSSWKKIKQQCSQSIASLIDLLQGKFDQGVMERLTQRDGGFFIEDLGSLNGTFLNRHRIETAELNDGDELQIGKYRLMFLLK